MDDSCQIFLSYFGVRLAKLDYFKEDCGVVSLGGEERRFELSRFNPLSSQYLIIGMPPDYRSYANYASLTPPKMS